MSEDKTSPRPWKLDYVDEPLIAPAKPGASSSNGWRPIETAPRDGTSIILYTDERNARPYLTSLVIAGWNSGCSFWANGHAETGWSEDHFTHWMPCPPGPGDTGKKGEG